MLSSRHTLEVWKRLFDPPHDNLLSLYQIPETGKSHPVKPGALKFSHLAALVIWGLFLAAANGAYVLELSKDSNLKEVFDAGLRPWMFSGELSRCDLSATDLTLKFEGLKIVPDFPVGRGFIEVQRNYSIERIELSTDTMEMPVAVSLAKRVASELDISPVGLDEVSSVTPFGSAYQPPKDWSAERNVGGVDVGLRFVAMPGRATVQASVHLVLMWDDRPLNKNSFWDTKMPPPPGYESVGFGTPPPSKVPPFPYPGPRFFEYLIPVMRHKVAIFTVGGFAIFLTIAFLWLRKK